MSPEEAVMLCRYVKACCPQQAIDQYTPVAWAEHLEDVPYADAKEAAKRITSRQPFVQIAELKAEVKRLRDKRIEEHPPLTPPPDLTPVETIGWLREARRRVADGESIDSDAAYGILRARNLAELPAALNALMPAPEKHPTPTEESP